MTHSEIKEENYTNLVHDIETYGFDLKGMTIEVGFDMLKDYPVDLADRLNKLGYKCDFDSRSVVITI